MLVVRVIEDQVVAAYAVTYVILLEVARWREISLGMVCIREAGSYGWLMNLLHRILIREKFTTSYKLGSI